MFLLLITALTEAHSTFAVEQFRAHGYHNRISLVGHGVGPWWHQQEPYIVNTCHQAFEGGMVLALELHGGYWHTQDMILVTSAGPTLLSDRFSMDEMCVIA